MNGVNQHYEFNKIGDAAFQIVSINISSLKVTPISQSRVDILLSHVYLLKVL